MPWPRRKVSDQRGDQYFFNPTRQRKFFRDYFGVQPVFARGSDGNGAAVGTVLTSNIMTTAVAQYEYQNLVGTATIVAPVWSAANGLDIAGDQTSAHGFEFTAGVGALSTGSFVIGTDRAFYIETQIKLVDASGIGELLFGFRINAAIAAARSSYTDESALGISASANPAAIKIFTRLNTGTEGVLDTTQTWADNETKTLRVVVKDDGNVRFYVNGKDPVVTNTGFKHDAGDSVNWFLRYLHAADLADNIYVRYIEQGYANRRGE